MIGQPRDEFSFETNSNRYSEVHVFLPKQNGRPGEMMKVRLDFEHPVTGQIIRQDPASRTSYLIEPTYIEADNPGFISNNFPPNRLLLKDEKNSQARFVFNGLNPNDHVSLKIGSGVKEQFKVVIRMKESNVIALEDSKGRIVFINEKDFASNRVPPSSNESNHNQKNAESRANQLAGSALRDASNEFMGHLGDANRIATAFIYSAGGIRLQKVNGAWQTVLYPRVGLRHDPQQWSGDTFFGEENKYVPIYRAQKEASIAAGKGISVINTIDNPSIHVRAFGMHLLDHNRIIAAQYVGVPIVIKLKPNITFQ
jgi:hypothetical protein